MSEYGPRHRPGPEASPDIEIKDFKPENFTRLESAEPIPDPNQNFDQGDSPKTPPPDPFQEFEVDRKPISSLMDDLPSLDGLFKPFNLEAPTSPDEAAFEEAYPPGPAQEYVFEDMDTRDPNIINTLAKAEARREEIIREAEDQADHTLKSAETEVRGRLAELEAQKQAILDQAGREADELSQAIRRAAAEEREAAESQRREMEAQRAAAEQSRREAEAQLAAAAERISGLDGEREKMEAEMAARKSEMEAEHSRLMADLESTRAALFEEAQKSGYDQGYAQGHQEGTAAALAQASESFQAKVEGFLTIMEKMEGLYEDLWQANGPMMIELAIEGAERILNRELNDRRDLAARAFEAAIDYLSQAHQVKLMVNPGEVAALEAARADQRQRLGALVSVQISPDPSLGPGDLIVESDVGRLDATVKHRSAEVLDVLKEAFAGNFNHRPDKFRVEMVSPRPEAETAPGQGPAEEEPIIDGEFEESPFENAGFSADTLAPGVDAGQTPTPAAEAAESENGDLVPNLDRPELTEPSNLDPAVAGEPIE